MSFVEGMKIVVNLNKIPEVFWRMIITVFTLYSAGILMEQAGLKESIWTNLFGIIIIILASVPLLSCKKKKIRDKKEGR